MFKYNQYNHNNIILHQISYDTSLSISEVVPDIMTEDVSIKVLCLSTGGSLYWGAPSVVDSIKPTNLIDTSPMLESIKGGNNITISKTEDGSLIIDCSLAIIDDGRLLGSEIYYKDDRIGIGRSPLYTYKLDISVPRDKISTGLHMGDSVHGFSFGNGTDVGYVPELISRGCEGDAALYILGITDSDEDNGIPLIVLDGRVSGGPLSNRPILGITSGANGYKVLFDKDGNVDANDFKINNVSLNDRIEPLEKELQKIKTTLNI